MKCPVCGTEAVEGGTCFYCEARKSRKKLKAVDPKVEPPESPRTTTPDDKERSTSQNS